MKTYLPIIFLLKGGSSSLDLYNIKISGFRNIIETEFNLSKITSLIALNGYGKSNIMDAISFGFDFIQSPNSQKSNMMAWKKGVPILKKAPSKNYSFEITYAENYKGKEYIVEYGFEFAWSTQSNPNSKIVSESLRIKLNEKGQKFNSLISRSSAKALYKSSETGRCNTPIKIDDNALIINKLLAYDKWHFFDVVQTINDLKFYLEKHLDPKYSYSADPLIIKTFDELEIDSVKNIPRAIYFLKKDYPDKYELLVNSFMQLFPNFTKIRITEVEVDSSNKIDIHEDIPFVFADTIYIMSVIDENLTQPINFDRLSDGVKRIFLMLTYAIIADIKGLALIAIEEPENSIHPRLLQDYINILSQLVNNCKIIFSSHSPYIIQYLDPSQIYIGLPNNDGIADFRKIAHSKIKMLLRDAIEYDESIGNYVFELLSNDDDGIEQIKTYLENRNE